MSVNVGDVITKAKGRVPILVTQVTPQGWRGRYISGGGTNYAEGPMGSAVKVHPGSLTRAQQNVAKQWKKEF